MMVTSLNASVTLSVDSDWGSGFVGTITIRNDGADAISGWTLDFPFPHMISSLWNGRIAANANGGYSISDAGWNATIPPGGSVSFGFVAAPNGTIFGPDAWTLNGETVGWGDPRPRLSISDTTVVEGDSGERFAEVVLRLTEPATADVSVDFATAGGTAWAGSDFRNVAGTVSFAAGEVEKVVRIPILGDTAVENSESFSLLLSNAKGIRVLDGRATVTIANDDAAVAPTIRVSDVSVQEGAAGAQTLATFTVRLSNSYDKVVTVDYATADDTATVTDGDYSAAAGTLTFAPGETSKTVTIVVNGDSKVEATERFKLLLSNATNGTIADAEGVGTIVTDDVLPRLSVADITMPEGTGDSVARVTVTLSAAFTEPVTVTYTTSVGTALPGQDYVTTTGSLTFAPGETTKVVEIPVVGDNVVEAQEYFFLNLSSPVNATIADGQGVIRLNNDDVPHLTVNDVRVTEGQDGTSTATFTVSLSGTWADPVTVDFATADGTGTVADGDYLAAAGSLTFAPGETTKTVSVTINGDRSVEADETVRLVLTNATNAIITDGEGVATIVSDDLPPKISIADLTMAEGNGPGVARVTVTLSNDWTEPVSVTYATRGGSAQTGSDFTAVTGTLTFAPGETTKVIEVPILGDTAAETAESFSIDLSAPVNGQIQDGTATVTLTNDDRPTVSVSIAHATVTESDPGALHGGGYFSVQGSQIVDDRGQAVRINGINWGGLQETVNAPFGIWSRPWKDLMNQMKELGFNTIRLPFSTDTLSAGPDKVAPHTWLNPDWAGKSALEIMDDIVGYAGEIGLRIILDRHRGESGGSADENGNGLWYYGEYTQERWINDWKMLAQRYAGNPTVIGADLHNEPYGSSPGQPEHGLATWGSGDPATDWRLAAEQAGNAILEVNPNWLIFVEGISTYDDNWYIWGGNLIGADQHPVRLTDPSKLVYSPHVYYRQPWHYEPDTRYDDHRKYWGYLHEQDRGAIMVGEFGSRLQNQDQVEWMRSLVAYMNGDYNGDGVSDLEPGELGASFTYWTFGPSSLDTGGILDDDWQTVLTQKMDIIRPGMIDLPRPDVGGNGKIMLTFAISLSSKAVEPVTVSYRTVGVTATEGEDFVGQSGTVTFRWGEMVKLVQVEVLADQVAEAMESLRLEITDAQGAVLGTISAVGSIKDDDVVGDASAASASTDGAARTASADPGPTVTDTVPVQRGDFRLWTDSPDIGLIGTDHGLVFDYATV